MFEFSSTSHPVGFGTLVFQNKQIALLSLSWFWSWAFEIQLSEWIYKKIIEIKTLWDPSDKSFPDSPECSKNPVAVGIPLPKSGDIVEGSQRGNGKGRE